LKWESNLYYTPNGYICLLSLQTAEGEISYIKKKHTEQAFEVEMFPKATDLVVKKGKQLHCREIQDLQKDHTCILIS
jgi:hypothetical protein